MINNDFLPANYEQPRSSSNYMKLSDGENRFRILSKPILGFLDWTSDKKPVRYRMDQQPSAPLVEGNRVKHFWAFVVWNVKEEKIQILELTQASIQAAIKALSADEDWGSPVGTYDIKITKKGTKLETEYTVTPVPKTPVSDKVREAFKEANVNLEELYKNGDPFANPKTGGSKSQPKKETKVVPVEEPKSMVSDDPSDDLPF